MEKRNKYDAPSKAKPRIRYPASDGPPRPTPIDIVIGRHQGSTVAIEATPARLQASKRQPIPNLQQRIEELSAENGHLRREMLYLLELHGDIAAVVEVMNEEDIIQRLENVLRVFFNYIQTKQRLDKEWSQQQGSNTYSWQEV